MLTGVVILFLLPDTPATSVWLSPQEKAWIAGALAEDAIRLGEPKRHGVLSAMREPAVLQLGVIGALNIGCFYALSLSAPALLVAATKFDITTIGYLTSIGGGLSMIGMLITGPLSDRIGSRFGILIGALLLLASGCAAMAFALSPTMVIAGYLMFMLAWMSVTNSQVLLWADLLPFKTLAVGCAAINSMNFVGGFVGPYLWGWAKDATGTYSLALTVMTSALLVAAGMVLALRAQTNRYYALAVDSLSV